MSFGAANVMNYEARSDEFILIFIESFFHRLKQGLSDENLKQQLSFVILFLMITY